MMENKWTGSLLWEQSSVKMLINRIPSEKAFITIFEECLYRKYGDSQFFFVLFVLCYCVVEAIAC